MGHIDLRLGQIVYISVFCDISSTGWFLVYFFVLCLLRDSENDLQGLVRTFFNVAKYHLGKVKLERAG